MFTNIFEDFEFAGISEQGTRLEFNVDNPAGIGFNRDVTVYTENGITSVDFSGKITVDGTAEIVVAANEDGRLVYSETCAAFILFFFLIFQFTPILYFSIFYVCIIVKISFCDF